MFDTGIVTYVSRKELPCYYKIDGSGRSVNVGIIAFKGPLPKVGDDVSFVSNDMAVPGFTTLHHVEVETEPTHETRWVDMAYYALQSKEIGLVAHAGNEAKIQNLLTKMYHKKDQIRKMIWGPYLNAAGWVVTLGALAAAVWSLT